MNSPSRCALISLSMLLAATMKAMAAGIIQMKILTNQKPGIGPTTQKNPSKSSQNPQAAALHALRAFFPLLFPARKFIPNPAVVASKPKIIGDSRNPISSPLEKSLKSVLASKTASFSFDQIAARRLPSKIYSPDEITCLVFNYTIKKRIWRQRVRKNKRSGSDICHSGTHNLSDTILCSSKRVDC